MIGLLKPLLVNDWRSWKRVISSINESYNPYFHSFSQISKNQKGSVMGKNIVLTLDGTWNTPASNTNIIQLEMELERQGSSPEDQISGYSRGVATNGFLDFFVGGFTGYGLDKEIKRVYKFLAENYEPNDNIYIFGFSRGAFAARAFATMLNNIGLVERDSNGVVTDLSVDKAYADYQNELVLTNNTRSGPHAIPIKFLGVYDTVGAMGFQALGPITQAAFEGINQLMYGYLNIELTKNVEIARHALAADEHLTHFAADVWKPNGVTNSKQRWFAGTHCDIGGGLPKAPNQTRQLSDVALTWMTDEARAAGMILRENALWTKEAVDPLLPIFSIFGISLRSLPTLPNLGYLWHNRPVLKESDEELAPEILLRMTKDEYYRPYQSVEMLAGSMLKTQQAAGEMLQKDEQAPAAAGWEKQQMVAAAE